jgi:hypothetical protein
MHLSLSGQVAPSEKNRFFRVFSGLRWFCPEMMHFSSVFHRPTGFPAKKNLFRHQLSTIFLECR